jgi:hypothetical protein
MQPAKIIDYGIDLSLYPSYISRIPAHPRRRETILKAERGRVSRTSAHRAV